VHTPTEVKSDDTKGTHETFDRNAKADSGQKAFSNQ
jgi:hypothetical protein